ncbi:MAG: ATP-binding protein [Chthoniobacteraceae bacterium]
MNPSSQVMNVAEFRNAITPDLYDPGIYIDWEGIEKDLRKFDGAINYLQTTADTVPIVTETLTVGLQNEARLYEVACLLLALPQTAIGFSDGRDLPEPGRPILAPHVAEVSALLIELGLPRLVGVGINVRALVRTALTGLDAGKRRYRVGATIKERLKTVVDQAIASASQAHSLAIGKVSEAQWPPSLRGRVDHLLALESRQCIAVASVFQTASGGRQQNELSTIYPNLQREIAELGLNLILVADGRGVREARESVLKTLFAGVASCMTFRQAATGRLLEEMLRLVKTEPPSQEQRALKSIIHAAVSAGGSISAAQLPADSKRASVSIATYVNENPNLDLILDPSGNSISWRKKDLVERALLLKKTFSPEAALGLFSQIFAASTNEPVQRRDALTYVVENIREGDGIIPKKLVVGATSTAPGPELAKQLAILSLTKTPDAAVAVLLTSQAPDGESAALLRRLQSTLTSNVIVIDSNLLLQMAQTKEVPRSILARQLLEQSDLIKASPFVVNSVTPGRMFYGRETEEADMVSTLGSNSIALLGGRRIGKTSLMRHVDARLKDGGFQTFFGDCQTVRDWDSFAEMAKRLWGVTLAHPFRPSHLFDLVRQLKTSADLKVVFLLDEIDQLLDWDKKHLDDQVPEAFFRACRTISQEAEAQFVFSGERTIAGRLWDPQSPHWNFCQPLMLRQLDRNAANQLLAKPLRAMQIAIQDEAIFSSVAWVRTNGHPQLLQTLGDSIVRLLNERPTSARAVVTSKDLIEVADVWSFAERYMETYWGQATDLERVLTLLISTGCDKLEGCRESLQHRGIQRSDDEVRSGLRMLELYGLTDASDAGYRIRLEWLNAALTFYGPIEKLLEQYAAKLK